MSSILSPYLSSPSIPSSLFKEPPEAVPPTDELEVLQAELRILRQKTLERAKKAGNDLKTIEESMRRMKEKEKGKAKAIEKVKRERAFTPVINGDEPKHSGSTPLPLPKNVLPPFPTASTGASSARSSLDPRPSTSVPEDSKKKKKKRKREDGSDIELEPQKIRKGSPALSQPVPHKPVKSTSSVLHSTYKASSGPDFSLPPSPNLLPARPIVQQAPVAGPSTPSEVREDFSKAKQPSQVLVSTFYTSLEPWLRPIKEEDLGFLEYTADEVEPFIMPKLGRHYIEVWEEQDVALYGSPLHSTIAARAGISNSHSAPRPKWDPSTLTEQDLVSEDKGHGPLTERLVSALLPVPNMSEWRGVKAAEDAMEGRPANGATAAAGKEKLSVAELEQRIKDTMRYHGLLDVNPDYSEAVDDPIATALRQAQLELRTVVATNNARKARLAAIARDRLGYQEYLELRDSIDRNINSLYTKLQKKDGPKTVKKKKKVTEVNGVEAPSTPAPNPAALGLGPDDDNRLVVPEQLKQLVQTRKQWVETVGGVFEAKQKEEPGRIWGIPQKSVFEGTDEVQLALNPTSRATYEPHVFSDNSTSRTTNKGQEKNDNMIDVR